MSDRTFKIVCGTLLFAICMIVILSLTGTFSKKEKKSEQTAVETEQAEPVTQIVEKVVEVKREITTEILQDGLRDMGFLVTEEYYFTEVINQSKVETLFDVPLEFTRSAYVCSYDGTITAGIDFTKIRVNKDDQAGIITVTLPLAEIQAVDVDPESFELYSETEGMGTRFTPEDYNQGLTELEATAKEKALNRGILTLAQDHAKTVIGNFINSMLEDEDYQLVYTVAEE